MIHIQFCQNAIPSITLPAIISECSAIRTIGAYSIFLGQIREDESNCNMVKAIDYTWNEEMARATLNNIANETQETFSTEYISVIHSLGTVNSGEICLLVVVACGHRKESMPAVQYLVERLKKEVPIWGREILNDNTHKWKVNT